jgi:hypothetical protein
MADAVELMGEDVQQETAHELLDGQGHRLVEAAPLGALILVTGR